MNQRQISVLRSVVLVLDDDEEFVHMGAPSMSSTGKHLRAKINQIRWSRFDVTDPYHNHQAENVITISGPALKLDDTKSLGLTRRYAARIEDLPKWLQDEVHGAILEALNSESQSGTDES